MQEGKYTLRIKIKHLDLNKNKMFLTQDSFISKFLSRFSRKDKTEKWQGGRFIEIKFGSNNCSDSDAIFKAEFIIYKEYCQKYPNALLGAILFEGERLVHNFNRHAYGWTIWPYNY